MESRDYSWKKKKKKWGVALVILGSESKHCVWGKGKKKQFSKA